MRSILKASMLALVAVSVSVVGYSAPAAAQAAADQPAARFIDQLSAKAFAVLRDKSLSREEARRQFRVMLKQNVAVKQVGDRLIRGFRSQVTRQQYAAYNAAFPDYVIGTYAARLYHSASPDPRIVHVQPVVSGHVGFS